MSLIPYMLTIVPGVTSAWRVETLSNRAAAALPHSVLQAALYLILALAGVTVLLTALGLGLVYAERKIAAHFQCRLGPMRVGPHGILQTVADTIKLLTKEDVVPENADKAMHVLAPLLCLAVPLVILGVLPYSPVVQGADVSIGVLFVTAVSGFGVMGILLGGWSSNNKWSMLGAMRAGAQIISYEVSATLALLVIVLFAGTMSLAGIVQSQQMGWWIWRAHGVGIVAFLVYLVASTAEINRTPFDIPEGESELTAGFHTEYSGLRFSFFFLAEFINMFIVAGLAVTLFLGGWMPFHLGSWASFNHVMDLIAPGVWFTGKTAFIVFLIMWFRWTFPRLRVDQLMHLEWKVLLPIGFVNLLVAALVVLSRFYFFPAG